MDESHGRNGRIVSKVVFWNNQNTIVLAVSNNAISVSSASRIPGMANML